MNRSIYTLVYSLALMFNEWVIPNEHFLQVAALFEKAFGTLLFYVQKLIFSYIRIACPIRNVNETYFCIMFWKRKTGKLK